MTNSQQPPNSTFFILCAGLVVAITLVSGLVHGRGSRRWGAGQRLETAGKELSDLPKTLGDWEVTSEEEVPKVVLETLECAGYVQRTYANQRGDQARIAIFVGPPGPISVHSPEVCYTSRNTTITEKGQLEIAASSFWMLRFKPETLAARPFRVFYAWSRDGREWDATENPRMTHGSEDLLYKIQLVFDDDIKEGDPDPAKDFLRSFLSRT